MRPLGRNLRCFLFATLLTFALATLYLAPLFPVKTVYYIQLRHHDQELCYMDAPKSKEGILAMSRILKEYGEWHIVFNGKILVPLKLLLDMDILRNYTSKARLPCPDKRFILDGHLECDLWIEADSEARGVSQIEIEQINE